MSFTRNYLKLLYTGFEAIKDFAFYPWNWATKDECQKGQDTNNLANDLIMCGVCLACNCAVCCCKAPVGCVGSVFTLPIGGTTALAFAAIGVVALPIPLAMDGTKLAIDGISSCCGQDNSSTNADFAPEPTSLTTNDIIVDLAEERRYLKK
jgi:hypothetical protein